MIYFIAEYEHSTRCFEFIGCCFFKYGFVENDYCLGLEIHINLFPLKEIEEEV